MIKALKAKIMSKTQENILKTLVYVFAAIGLFFVVGFLAVKFHLTDSLGKVDTNDRYFQIAADKTRDYASGRNPRQKEANLCRVWVLSMVEPDLAKNILDVYLKSGSETVLYRMLSAQEVYLQNNDFYREQIKTCDNYKFSAVSNYAAWKQSEEWLTLKEAVAKDKETIGRASVVTGVEPRMIVSMLVGEQLRLFNSYREVFKQFFQPLKILGNETKFSLGVTGVKEETAIRIENDLKDPTSPFYLGSEFEHLLDFTTANVAEERFNRLTNDKDHYYSYLYAALFLKEVEKQWASAGYNISDRPDILATLYNLGFDSSVPKKDPQVGGSVFTINGVEYTFGSVSHQFYYSGELFDEFPL